MESTNPKDRLGRLKPSLHLIPASAQIIESMVMALGAKKYGAYNWRAKNVAATVYIAAAMRHLLSWLDREEYDDESGVSHLGHARACLGILLDAQTLGKLVDDRPTGGIAGQMIRAFTINDQKSGEKKNDQPEQVIEGGGDRVCADGVPAKGQI